MKPNLIKKVFTLASMVLLSNSFFGQINAKPGDFPGPKTSFKTYNETILRFTLGNEIGFKNRVMRMHYSTMSPGAIIVHHKHKDRPTVEYVLEGTVKETKKDTSTVGGKVIIETLKEGQNELSTGGIHHWWKNDSPGMVKLIAIDIWKDSVNIVCRPEGDRMLTDSFKLPSNPVDVKTEFLGVIDLGKELIGVPEAKNYLMRSRRLTIMPNEVTKLQDSKGKPAIIYVIRGDVFEHRNTEQSLTRRTGEYSVANDGVQYYFENPTIEPVILWVVDIVKKGDENKK